MRDNLNKTGNTLDRKNQDRTKTWYATTGDTFDTLQETVDIKEEHPPHAKTVPLTYKNQRKPWFQQGLQENPTMPVLSKRTSQNSRSRYRHLNS